MGSDDFPPKPKIMPLGCFVPPCTYFILIHTVCTNPIQNINKYAYAHTVMYVDIVPAFVDSELHKSELIFMHLLPCLIHTLLIQKECYICRFMQARVHNREESISHISYISKVSLLNISVYTLVDSRIAYTSVKNTFLTSLHALFKVSALMGINHL